ncbi:DUF2184 domain-containing protein [Pantoea brenneri]|uniref:major capsid family protein n=1 Tax=Pantoea brenneri TaxID=472694 RepID=UPI00244AC4CA|nr:major capsid family protein [Pantoea brenneri]MDH1085306.1 DUF2184 domain-containing protein [Pantoea brenneri]
MKIGQLFNLPKFKAFMDSAKRPGFTDTYGGITLARDLTMINPKIFEKKYPELSFVNSGIQVDNTGGYANQIESLRLIDLGSFADATDESDNKGKISLAGESSLIKVKKREAHSKWSDDEVKEAGLRNVNLVQQFLSAHNKIYMREIDTAGYLGIAGNKGLLNESWATSAAASDADNMTGQDLYNEIAGLINAQWDSVMNVPEYMANRVDMPPRVLNRATVKMIALPATGNTTTVIKALRDNFPGVTFGQTARAESIAKGGGVQTSVTVAYSNNPDAMVMRIPQPLEISEIIKVTGFDFRVDSKYRVAGLDVLEHDVARTLTGL